MKLRDEYASVGARRSAKRSRRSRQRGPHRRPDPDDAPRGRRERSARGQARYGRSRAVRDVLERRFFEKGIACLTLSVRTSSRMPGVVRADDSTLAPIRHLRRISCSSRLSVEKALADFDEEAAAREGAALSLTFEEILPANRQGHLVTRRSTGGDFGPDRRVPFASASRSWPRAWRSTRPGSRRKSHSSPTAPTSPRRSTG